MLRKTCLQVLAVLTAMLLWAPTPASADAPALLSRNGPAARADIPIRIVKVYGYRTSFSGPCDNFGYPVDGYGRRIRWRFQTTIDVHSTAIRNGFQSLDFRYQWSNGGRSNWRRVTFDEAGPDGTAVRKTFDRSFVFRSSTRFMQVRAEYPSGTFYSNIHWLSIRCTRTFR
ncbi:hypothetical protein SAMN05421505_110150 [Sinosporangium album]|uniref:Uncharacterized protein n=1 Tax=Sinosporangium album TaxID=504805 RepID=A0A1G7Z178_9ACTN|nr:hypothetical protein [Sinosporangium album]SDH02521.1 hypothetical protein SAMN05421505_110150 [Sinosporangium album]